MKQDAVGEIKARITAWRYGNPAKDVKIIAVAGPHGKTTTALFLGEILQEAGIATLVLTNRTNSTYDQSVETLQTELQKAKKDGVFYVVVEVTERLLATCNLTILPIELSIITGDSVSARGLLEHPASSCVIPAGLDVNDIKVAPHQIISVGVEQDAEALIANVTERRKGTEIEMVIDHQTRIELATYLVGYANAMNLAAAVSAAYVLAVDTVAFQEGAARLERIPGNYDYIERDDLPYDIVVDGANTAEALERVLTSAKNLKKRRLLVVLDGSVPEQLYSNVVTLADRVFVVSENLEAANIEKASSVQAAVDLAKRAAKKSDTLLLLGREFSNSDDTVRTMAHQMIGEIENNEQH